MKIKWTKRARRRLIESARYIAVNFYPEYAIAFTQAAERTANMLTDNPDLGHEAFRDINRPEIRKLLCDHYDYWIYYRRRKTICDILSIRHTLMNIDSPSKL